MDEWLLATGRRFLAHLQQDTPWMAQQRLACVQESLFLKSLALPAPSVNTSDDGHHGPCTKINLADSLDSPRFVLWPLGEVYPSSWEQKSGGHASPFPLVPVTECWAC